jgi:hypothetical protein
LGTQPQFQFLIGFFETFLVDGKFKGLSNKPLHTRFGVMVIKEFFLFQGTAGNTKNFFKYFLENKRKLCHIR